MNAVPGAADPMHPSSPVCAVVLAGGESRRFGSDKLSAALDGVPVLDRLVSALPAAWMVILVGPVRALTRRDVLWVREDPPGGGPSAGIQAGAASSTGEVTVVVAGDMPYAASVLPALADALVRADDGVQAAVGVDDEGQANPLLAAYRTQALQAALPEPAHGIPAKRLLALPHLTLAVHGQAARDVDTPGDLRDLAGGTAADEA